VGSIGIWQKKDCRGWFSDVSEKQSMTPPTRRVSCARYVRSGGEVAVQKNLSRERPGYRSFRVNTVIEMVQVVCRNGVVWGLTCDRNLVVRVGVSSASEDGAQWAFLQSGFACFRFNMAVYVWLRLTAIPYFSGHLGPLSLAVPPCAGAMSTGNGFGHCWGRNGEFCVALGPATKTASILAYCMIA